MIMESLSLMFTTEKFLNMLNHIALGHCRHKYFIRAMN